MRDVICMLLNVCHYKYLGVPIARERLRARDLEDVVGKIRMRLAGWKVGCYPRGLDFCF